MLKDSQSAVELRGTTGLDDNSLDSQLWASTFTLHIVIFLNVDIKLWICAVLSLEVKNQFHSCEPPPPPQILSGNSNSIAVSVMKQPSLWGCDYNKVLLSSCVRVSNANSVTLTLELATLVTYFAKPYFWETPNLWTFQIYISYSPMRRVPSTAPWICVHEWVSGQVTDSWCEMTHQLIGLLGWDVKQLQDQIEADLVLTELCCSPHLPLWAH